MSTEQTTPLNKPNRCINCTYCQMFDATCAHPENDFCDIDYETPACPLYEPETLN